MHKDETQSWGIASLVLSIIGVISFFAPYIGIVCSILAVIFYNIQKKRNLTGVAKAGLIIGIIGIVTNTLMLILVIGVLAFLGAIGSYDDVSIQATERVQGVQELPEEGQRVRSATIEIIRVTESVANLDAVRISVTNTGNTLVTPNFDIEVTDTSGNTICEGSPYFGIGSVQTGETVTDEITLLGCTFEKDGDYIVKVDLLDRNYNLLDTDSEELVVNYWNKFGFG